MQWNAFRTHIRHLPASDQERVREAFELCIHAHEGQLRKSGEPYATHPIAVAQILAGMEADTDTLAAALLHDVLEDTAFPAREIQNRFGLNVISLIEGVTKLDDAGIRAHPTLDEEIETLRKIFTSIEQDVRIMVIKIADRLHNMQTIEYLRPERQISMAQETADIFVKIADRMSMQDMRDELEGLCLAVLEPETFEQLLVLRSENEKEGATLISLLSAALRKAAPRLPLQVRYESKTWDHLRTMLEQHGSTSGHATLTVAIVCESIPQCYETLGLLHQLWQYEILSFKDFINAIAINGYRGLHTTIILKDGTRVRCKIRTHDMHAYARKGIASHCFDGKNFGIAHYLPWAERIIPLSKDTVQRSQEFWESLQSDILGKSTLIYGPDNRAVQIPKGASALDGAFYLFKERALHLTSLTINGDEVPPFSPIDHTVSMDITLSERPTVTRDWLDWVHTGLATAMIRTSLSAESRPNKVEKGRALLQEAMVKQARGYLQEFTEESVLRGLKAVGYPSLAKAYMAIADGHLSPSDAIEAIFKKPGKNGEELSPAHSPFRLRFSVHADSLDIVQAFLPFERKYRIAMGDIRLIPITRNRVWVSIRCHLSPDEQRSILSELAATGVEDATLASPRSRSRTICMVALIFVLWGLDPVFAALLLHSHSVQPMDLMVVRFFTLTGMSVLLFTLALTRSPLRQVRLPFKSPSLWLSAIAMVTVAYTTYLSLVDTPPTHYTLPMTAAGVLLTTIVNRKHWKTMTVAWASLLSGIALLIAYSPQWSWTGVCATLGALVAFSVFSLVSERYKKQEQVAARAAQYFLFLSILCTLGILPLLALTDLTRYSSVVLARMILFCIFFAGAPYYIYYYMLTHREIDFVLRYSFLLIFFTLIGQIAFFTLPAWNVILLPTVLVLFGAGLPLMISSSRR